MSDPEYRHAFHDACEFERLFNRDNRLLDPVGKRRAFYKFQH